MPAYAPVPRCRVVARQSNGEADYGAQLDCGRTGPRSQLDIRRQHADGELGSGRRWPALESGGGTPGSECWPYEILPRRRVRLWVRVVHHVQCHDACPKRERGVDVVLDHDPVPYEVEAIERHMMAREFGLRGRVDRDV
jgi:hypothetical protein